MMPIQTTTKPALLLLAALCTLGGSPGTAKPICNETVWNDIAGNPISCHDGGITRVGDRFYWYGTSYKGNPSGLWGRQAAALQNGFNCYSSKNLVDWTYEGVCLEFPKSGWLATGTSHRPNVLHNDKTGKYVMWFFSIGTTEPEYPAAMLAVAVADKPTGPFTFLGRRDTAEEHGWGQDLGLFKDRDGKGYLVYDDGHRNIRVDLLADDYLSTTGKTAIALKSDGLSKRYEGAALIRYKGKYIAAGSGVKGWKPTDTSYAVADAPLGPYREMGLMSEENTWSSQISNFLHIAESDVVLAMCDQWFRGPGGERVPIDQSCQLWLPVAFDPATGVAKMLHVGQWEPWSPPAPAKAQPARDAPSGLAAVDPKELGFEEIVFVKRRPYSSDHYYTDITNGTSPDRFDPDNGIYVYDLRTRSERAVVRAADLPGGMGFIGKISLSFDARKLLFDFRQDPGSGFRIWEVNVDGTSLRQVSFPPQDEAEKAARWSKSWHTDDIHPCYLPDGTIIFSSTRCEHTILCAGSAQLVAAGLHRMNADGTHVEQLTHSPVSEFCPVVLDDGRVMYHRWEYVDKGARVAKTVRAMNPDGTGSQELYGLADDDTTVYMYPQPLPGSNHRFVCVGTCHHPQGGCLGAILLVDFGKGVRERGPDPDEPGYIQWDDRYPVVSITPDVFVARKSEPGWRFLTKEGKYVEDREGRTGHLYTHPFPVSNREFLVSYKVDPLAHFKNVPHAYALYLLDTNGQRRFVHADSKLSCWHPLPLVARPVPPQIHTSREPQYVASNQARCILTNAYQGMEGVERGSIKWLRINEALPRYWSTGRRWEPSLSSSSWKAALWPRVQWGVVPVEEDGSAHFLAPADRAIFLQALDEDFREVQRERTYVNYAPGEVRSCSGCHGQSNRTALRGSSPAPLALARAPSIPQPQPCDLVRNGGDGRAGQVIHYPTDIQPLLDAKCVKCHGPNDPAGGLRLTGEVTVFYSTSYEMLAKKELAGPIIPEFKSFLQEDRGNYNGAYLRPRSLGCPTSVLIALLTDAAHPKNAKDDHSKMLTGMELMRVSRWVDTNYQFYGSYFGRQHPQWRQPDPAVPAYDPADFRRKATFEEAIGFLAPSWHR